MFWLISCLLGLVGWVTPKYLNYRRMKQMLQSFPTFDRGILGSFFALYRVLTWKPSKDFVGFINALGHMHWKQSCSVVWILHQPIFVARRPEYVEAIMSGSINKSSFYEYMKPYMGNGLITSNGTLWKKHRVLLNKAFHFRMLEEFIPIMNKQAKILLMVLNERNRCDTWINIHPLIERCTLDIICETSIGIELRSQHGDYPEYLEALNEIQKFAVSRMLNPLKRLDFLYFHTSEGKRFLKYLLNLKSFTKEAFKQRKEEIMRDQCKLCHVSESDIMHFTHSRSSLKPMSLMNLLLHFHLHEKALSEEEVQDEVNTFMASGHETTSLCVTWTLYLLGLHPQVQEKVHEELTHIFASDKERPSTNQDIRMMKYLECVIKESLRVLPVIPLIGYSAEKDIPIGQDLLIPRGTECAIPFYSIFHDKKAFPRPERFIPERFLPGHSNGRNTFYHIPFSAGPRNCIGQRYAMNEVKVILSSILRSFSLKSLDPQDQIIVDTSITLKPKCPIRITFKPR